VKKGSRRAGANFRPPAQPISRSAISGPSPRAHKGKKMNSIIYLVGLVVVVLAILSFFGLG